MNGRNIKYEMVFVLVLILITFPSTFFQRKNLPNCQIDRKSNYKSNHLNINYPINLTYLFHFLYFIEAKKFEKSFIFL